MLPGLVLILTACAAWPAPTAPAPTAPTPTAVVPTAVPLALELPPAAGRVSYQIGGAYPVPAGVNIVDRDHAAAPDEAAYSICYVNAYQSQPGEINWWATHHPDLLLRNNSGELIIDTQWQEALFDISTAAKRAELLEVVGGWIDGCADRGYRAVEADNLDSYLRSEGRLTSADALALAGSLATRGHARRLAIGQKNAAEISAQGLQAGFDFAVAEQCQTYGECDQYRQVYGDQLIEIEYTDGPAAAFDDACRVRGREVSILLRDPLVTPASSSGHVERWCP